MQQHQRKQASRQPGPSIKVDLSAAVCGRALADIVVGVVAMVTKSVQAS